MAFEILTDKLTAAIQKLRGQKTVSEQDLKETLREVRLALLEADVNFKVVKEFTAKIKERGHGPASGPNLTPGQYIVKIVHEELIELLGGTQSKLNTAANPPTVIMLVGLQGAGKTTTVGKLANYLRKNGKKPLMVAEGCVPSCGHYPAGSHRQTAGHAGVHHGGSGFSCGNRERVSETGQCPAV